LAHQLPELLFRGTLNLEELVIANHQIHLVVLRKRELVTACTRMLGIFRTYTTLMKLIHRLLTEKLGLELDKSI
jgi:hypothetical protein